MSGGIRWAGGCCGCELAGFRCEFACWVGPVACRLAFFVVPADATAGEVIELMLELVGASDVDDPRSLPLFFVCNLWFMRSLLPAKLPPPSPCSLPPLDANDPLKLDPSTFVVRGSDP